VASCGFGPELSGCGPGRGGDVGEAGREVGEGLAVAFEGFAFGVGEVELFEHLVDAGLDLQELAAVGVLGQVERAADAGQAMGALGEEVVGAEPLAARSAPAASRWPA
jgi:hypothetical protein